MDDYDKLSHIGPVEYENFYSKLKVNTLGEYTKFVQEFHSRGCITMMDWSRVYNEADVIPFIEAVDKTHKQYYPDEIDMLKDVVSIPGISITYALNKALKMKKLEILNYMLQGNLASINAITKDALEKL